MSPVSLLVLDVGNTAITAGLYNGNRLTGPWRLGAHRDRTADEYAVLLQGLLQMSGRDRSEVKGLAVASVVPPAIDPITRMALSYLGLQPLIVGPGVKTGVPIRTENPLEVGADRIVNAVAAFARYGGPVLVVDLGTATTVDAISAKGEYLGGAIAPGVGVAAEALFHHTARLPRVVLKKPARVIGRSTVSSIQSGLVYGYASLVDGLVLKMMRELVPPGGEGVKVVATGGHAAAIVPECGTLQRIDQDLTLDGLRRIWLKNRTASPHC